MKRYELILKSENKEIARIQFRADIDDKNVQVFTHTLQVSVQSRH